MRLSIAVGLALSLSSPALPQAPTKSEATAALFGKDVSGQALVDGDTTALCAHFNRLANATAPNARNLLITNRSLTKFFSMTCNGECDLEEMNNALVHCQIAPPVDSCVFYSGLYQNNYFTMALKAPDIWIPDVCMKDPQ